MGVPRVAWLVAAVLAWMAAPAAAQDARNEFQARHLVLSGGATFDGSYGAGDATAELRGNLVGPSAPPFTWFDASATVDGTVGLFGRVGFALGRNLAVDGGLAFAKPKLRVSITGDAEAAASAAPEESLQQYEVDAAVRWLTPLRLGSRGRPYLTAGAGYLRQLHEGRTLVETGQSFHAGGGLMYWFHGGGRSRAFGVAADARVTWHAGGVNLAEGARPFGRMMVSAFVGL